MINFILILGMLCGAVGILGFITLVVVVFASALGTTSLRVDGERAVGVAALLFVCLFIGVFSLCGAVDLWSRSTRTGTTYPVTSPVEKP